MTTDAVTITLGTSTATVSELPLCPRCHETCYRPLAPRTADSDAPVHALLIIATDDAGRRR